MDDPAADYAILPTFLLAAEAAKELKVVLTGEGGDELFAGYGRYRSALRSPFLGGRPMRRRGSLDGLGVLRDSSRRWRVGISAAERRLAAGQMTRLQQAQAIDCADWLPNDLLLKIDRCLMAHGLEGRTPFLDPVIADLAFRLPDGLKIAARKGKYLLRRWLETALPAADPFSEKRGFTVPVAEWMRPRARHLAPLLAQSAGFSEICHPEKVGTLFRAFGERGGKQLRPQFGPLHKRRNGEPLGRKGGPFSRCHCEERSDEAISFQLDTSVPRLLRCARNDRCPISAGRGRAPPGPWRDRY